jgi:hypothetical protein
MTSGASSDLCVSCGTKNGEICCFNGANQMVEKKCTDGSVCNKSTGRYCVHPTHAFGSPCSKLGEVCKPIANLTCQKDPMGGTGDLKCLCKENFKSCNADGSKMCVPPIMSK